jgi:sugar (pentulose or hexulose) kinase
MLTLGLDIGSSIAKAALFDENLNELSRAAAPLALDRSRPGRVEFDPTVLPQVISRLIGEVCSRRATAPGRIDAVGICAAMVGGILLDDSGQPQRAGINWEDARADGMIRDMEALKPGTLSAIFSQSGCVLQQGCTLPVLAALQMEEPETVARAHAFVSLKDFVRAWLTGRIGADRTEAAVAPGSARSGGRAEDLISLFGLDAIAHLLPPPEDSEALGGTISQSAARQTGLRPGIPVAVGAGDVPASVLGAGGFRTGNATVLLGTTAMLGLTVETPVFDPPDLGLLFTLPGGKWYRAMVNVAGTLNLDWALQNLVPDLASGSDAFPAIEQIVERVPIGAEGAVYLPYLSDSGIIAPVIDRDARAVFAGLAPRHGRPQMLRAIYEGVAFSIADLLELCGFRDGSIVLVGGGARSAIWPQMLADIVQAPVELREGSEFGARGAALLALVASGRFRSVADAAELTPKTRMIHYPSAERKATYRLAHGAFRSVRARMIGI